MRRTTGSILVCLDGSPLGQSGLGYAVAVARATHAPVHLVRVLERDAVRTTTPVDTLSSEISRSEAGAYLNRIADSLKAHGLSVGTEIAEGGAAAEQILRVARRIRASLVVVASRGLDATPFGLGSTAHKVAQHASQSLLLVPTDSVVSDSDDGFDRIERVLVPLDGSLSSEIAVPRALQLAKSEGAELLLAHVVSPVSLPACGPLAREDRELQERLASRAVELAHTYLRRVQHNVQTEGVRCRYIVRSSPDSAHGIRELVEHEKCGIIVVASTGVDMLHGSLTQYLINHSPRPVWIVQDEAAVRAPDAPLLAPHSIAGPQEKASWHPRRFPRRPPRAI